jgi:hypothetical protein
VTPAQSRPARDVFGDQGWRWLRDGELSLLPPPVQPARVRWVWVALVVVLLGLVAVAVAIGARL